MIDCSLLAEMTGVLTPALLCGCALVPPALLALLAWLSGSADYAAAERALRDDPPCDGADDLPDVSEFLIESHTLAPPVPLGLFGAVLEVPEAPAFVELYNPPADALAFMAA